MLNFENVIYMINFYVTNVIERILQIHDVFSKLKITFKDKEQKLMIKNDFGC